MKEQIIKILTAINAPQSLIDEIGESIDNLKDGETIEPKTGWTEAMEQSYRERFENDPEIKSKFESAAEGKHKSMAERSIIKAFGLSAKDVEGKKMDEILDMAKDEMSKNKDKTASELQKQIQELSNERKRLLEEEIPAARNEGMEKLKQIQLDTKLKGMLSENELIVKPDLVLPSLVKELEGNYNIDLTEKGEIEITTKDGLKPMSEDKTKVMTPQEIIQTKLEDYEVLKKSNGKAEPKPDEGETPPDVSTPETQKKFAASHNEGLAKAEKLLREVK
jgi:hypothetical protein